ncbi:MAG: hypothetical protein WC548_03395 [Candidatus Pacearchaeota archaeon]
MPELKLINSRFIKINGERNLDFSGEISAKTNIKILDLNSINNSKNSIQIKYFFEIDYEKLGKIQLEGIIYVLIDVKTYKELLKSWESKKIETPDFVNITNLIIQKASLKSFELEEELGLPIHIRLPKVDLKPNN